jgi:hypothetical protein
LEIFILIFLPFFYFFLNLFLARWTWRGAQMLELSARHVFALQPPTSVNNISIGFKTEPRPFISFSFSFSFLILGVRARTPLFLEKWLAGWVKMPETQ